MSEKYPPAIENLKIVQRARIDVPPEYVSVYHETTAAALESINTQGLVPGAKKRNIGSATEVDLLNQFFDQNRPGHLESQGVSRVENTYAYNSLLRGFSLGFAARRYMNEPTATMRQRYDAMAQYPDELEEMGVQTFDQYMQKMRDPRHLRQIYPGEVLELKVNPLHAFVGDLAIYTNVALAIDEADGSYRSADAAPYWQNMVTLKDFQKWYSPQEVADGRVAYARQAGSPGGLADCILSPEVLIPDAVPPAHIRVLP